MIKKVILILLILIFSLMQYSSIFILSKSYPDLPEGWKLITGFKIYEIKYSNNSYYAYFVTDNQNKGIYISDKNGKAVKDKNIVKEISFITFIKALIDGHYLDSRFTFIKDLYSSKTKAQEYKNLGVVYYFCFAQAIFDAVDLVGTIKSINNYINLSKNITSNLGIVKTSDLIKLADAEWELFYKILYDGLSSVIETIKNEDLYYGLLNLIGFLKSVVYKKVADIYTQNFKSYLNSYYLYYKLKSKDINEINYEEALEFWNEFKNAINIELSAELFQNVVGGWKGILDMFLSAISSKLGPIGGFVKSNINLIISTLSDSGLKEKFSEYYKTKESYANYFYNYPNSYWNPDNVWGNFNQYVLYKNIKFDLGDGRNKILSISVEGDFIVDNETEIKIIIKDKMTNLPIAGAEVIVNGSGIYSSGVTDADGIIKFYVKPNYKDFVKIKALKEGYISGEINIPVFQKIQSTPEFGKLTINTNINNVSIYIRNENSNNYQFIKTIQNFIYTIEDLKPGIYYIKLTCSGYKDIIERVEIKAGKEEIITGRFESIPVIKLGGIIVYTNPTEADVYIRTESNLAFLYKGKTKDKEPVVIPDLTVGEYIIKVSKPGYKDSEVKVNLGPEEVKTITVNLEKSYP